MDERKIVRKIKELRLERNLSLQKLAELCGLTKGYISKIEKADKAPPLSTLGKIATALGVDVYQTFLSPALISDQSDSWAESSAEFPANIRLSVVRKHERKHFSSKSLQGFHYEALAYKKSGRNMEPVIIISGFEEDVVFSHEGEEFIYTLEGTHEFIYGSQKYILNEGDSIYFDSIIPHSGRSLGKKKAKLLAVMYWYKRTDNTHSFEARIKDETKTL